MGVTGLWRLVEPAGKPVPVETLENKVLAVDISIWLHQMVKGYQDAKGAPLPNAHLIGLFQRLCKLLYFRIKPVFVFDGGFPALKRETIAKRQDSKSKYHSESERLKRELTLLLSKKTAIGSLLGKQISPTKKSSSSVTDNDDMFKLPALPESKEEECESETEDDESSDGSVIDLHSVDIESENFKNMSVKDKYNLLIELKETRKMNSWGKIHELPKKSDNFSDFQMKRLLKRRKVQECLEDTEKEMGDMGMTLNDLESLLNEEGIDTKIESLPFRRIASNNSTRYLLINNVKQVLADAKEKKEAENVASTSKTENEAKAQDPTEVKKDELDDDLQKAIQMSLECDNENDESANTSKTDDSWTSCMTDTDSEEDDGFEPSDMTCAKSYIMQYSDLTNRAIDNIIIKRNKPNKKKQKIPKVNEILDEINKEKSIVVDNVYLSSDDENNLFENVITVNDNIKPKLEVDRESSLNDVEMDSTQASVIVIENTQQILSLDTSYEDDDICEVKVSQSLSKQYRDCDNKVTNKAVKFGSECITSIKKEPELSDSDCEESFKCSKDDSESSESEFEDVPELETESSKAVVELNFEIKSDLEDDIFADVFTSKQKSITIEKKTDTPVKLFRNNVSENKDNNMDQKLSKYTSNIEKTLKEKEAVPMVSDVEKQVNASSSVEAISTPSTSSKVALSNSPNTTIENTKDATSNVHVFKIPDPPREVRNPPKVSTETLNTMVEEIQNEEQNILNEKGRLDRVGRNITQEMTKEAQELLQILGVPYIVAPMEAEAQCAYLESINLTDGTITDDSDIWLFGGKTVYKNFFNQKKHVLQFISERIEKSFNLSRDQLILLALLVGSDYTTGVTGVGPVTALEILASFPYNKKSLISETTNQGRYAQIVTGLQEFKRWVKAGRRTENITLKKKLKNVDLTEDFPSVRVVQAYLEPNVERSEEKFTWGEIDITILRDYTKAKFGWSQNKLDEIIKPVLKRLSERKSQKSVKDYFKKKIDFHSLEDQMSKRVKAAVQRMDPNIPKELLAEEETVKPKQKRKNKSENKVLSTAGPSQPKQVKIDEESVLAAQGVRVVSQVKDGKSTIDIVIPKTSRVQEIIPQREKVKQDLLQNKLKAIEVFRKTQIDKKKKPTKKRAIQPKAEAELSESSDSN